MEHITAHDLKRMYISAYHTVRDGRERINKINVFPVPDQDTGNNLTRTLKGIHDAIADRSYESIHALRSDILDGSLTFASGNVGIIMTSFINGLLSPLPEHEAGAVHIEEGMREAVKQSFEAIQEPKAGTILDTIQAASQSFTRLSKIEDDIVTLLKQSLVESQKALNETMNLMEIYKKVSVVDAGAYGFVLFLEGLIEGLQNTRLVIEEENKTVEKTRTFIQILSNRYEVVSLLDSPNKKRTDIIKKLETLGNSIDIVEANNKVKIHIHTDYPDEVVEHISGFGTVLQMRTYDMTKGPEEYTKAGARIGLVTDDGASVPLPLSMKLDIAVVPFQTSWEKADDDPHYAGKTVYQKMRSIRKNSSRYGWPKTSQPTQKAYFQAFTDQLKKYQEVLCFTISSQLSGAYNSAQQARKMLPGKDRERVFIPDHYQAGGGQGILLLEAARMINTGMDMKDILKRLEKETRNVKVLGFTEDPAWLAEGGRISKSQGRLMGILRTLLVHPIFHLKNGKVGLKGFQLGHNHLPSRAYRLLKKNTGTSPLKIVINHADNPRLAEELKKLLDDIPHELLYESMLPPVLGIHTGPDSMIISYL